MYTVVKIASLLQVHTATVERWIRDGKLKAHYETENWRPYGRPVYLITEEDFKNFLLYNPKYQKQLEIALNFSEVEHATLKEELQLLEQYLNVIKTLVRHIKNNIG